MFDRTSVFPVTRNEVHEVTKHVHHHRAPTDESVKALRELEQAATAKIIDSVRVGDATFECVVHVMRTMIDDTVHLKAIFSLNGKKLEAEYTAPRLDYDKAKAVVGLRDAMAKEIATAILLPALQWLDRDPTFGRLR